MDYLINPDVSWIRALEHVFKFGTRSSPRGMAVYECLAHQTLVDMNNPIIMNPNRKLGYKFMAAEAAWILHGLDDVASIAPYSKDISKFSDNGETFFGAYGPKVRDQMPFVVATLHEDPDSRQAVINIWRESPAKSKDIPCTLSLQFLIRENVLHCVASMRSSDLWLGHVYDIFNFSAVSFMVLLEVNKIRKRNGDIPISLGTLFLTCGSKHIYARNIEQVSQLLQDYEDNGLVKTHPHQHRVFEEDRYDNPDEFVLHLWEAANTTDGILSLVL